MRILVTGCAGFIGSAVSQNLLEKGYEVIGVDNCNDYYDVTLKEARLSKLIPQSNFTFYRTDIQDEDALLAIFAKHKPNRVIHLAAQAGVRYSLENPKAYVDSNLVGFVNIIEACRRLPVEHLVFASSSSVYGANTKMPYSVHDAVDHPLSLYAATKKSNELIAHAYSHLYQLPVTGLRFFTVYGPWGRPDMALHKFAMAISKDQPITIYNHGHHKRDFTYISDIVAGIFATLNQIPKQEPTPSAAPYSIYNIGYGRPIALLSFVELLETALGKKAQKIFEPAQAGDVAATWADITDFVAATDYQPTVAIEEGIPNFVAWFKDYYSLHK
jgi:UDP-glucuronate 4-epimerase